MDTGLKLRRRGGDSDPSESESEVGGRGGRRPPRPRGPGFRELHAAITAQRAPQQIVPVPITQPIAPQPVALTGAGAAVPVKAKPGVVIKQIVKQEVGTRKARKKRVSKSNKQATKQKKSEYTALKKNLRKRLIQLKKKAFSAQAARIKSLPAKERPAARKSLRVQLKKAHDEKLKQLPALGKRKYNDIVALINKLKKIKW